MNKSSQLTQGLDYYKATMSQVEYKKIPDAVVTFELKNRGENKLSEFVTPEALSARLEDLQKGWSPEELAYLAGLQNRCTGLPQFSPEFLDYLADNDLPPVDIGLDSEGELTVRTTGPAPLVTFWETVVMSELNEMYFAAKLASEGKSLEDLYAEGDRRLSDKIALLKKRPDIKFSDFGTRRRFSYAWQKHVIERVAAELPENFMGTSNIFLAHKLGLTPVGTSAHEPTMIYSGLEQAAGKNPLLGHNKLLQDWQEVYGGDLSTALTDTFTSEFFFTDFTPQQAEQWKALRHDSGDPFEFGDRVIEFYEQHGIDPTEKTIVFSDGLDVDTIIKLADYFAGKIPVVFGWGTTLTNDLGVETNNFVMKVVAVNGQSTVKLSNVEGKHTGPPETIQEYIQYKNRAIHMGATAWQAMCIERPEGKGVFRQWGPNYTADPVIIAQEGDDVRVLTIIRSSNGKRALTGGFLDIIDDKLEDPHAGCVREAMEEASIDISADPAYTIYDGPVRDDRETLNAWPHTHAKLFVHKGFTPVQASDDAVEGSAEWTSIDQLDFDSLHGSHGELIKDAVKLYYEIQNK